MNLAIMVLLEINILKQISVYNRNTNKLLFTGTIGECAKFFRCKTLYN